MPFSQQDQQLTSSLRKPNSSHFRRTCQVYIHSYQICSFMLHMRTLYTIRATNARNVADRESAKMSCAFGHYLLHDDYLLSLPSTMKMKTTWSPKFQLIFNGLHGVMSQKVKFFLCLFFSILVILSFHCQLPTNFSCLDRMATQSHDHRSHNHMSKKRWRHDSYCRGALSLKCRI
jgi:hypothetical protein